MIMQTTNLLIRPPEERDFEDYWVMNNDPVGKKYTGGVMELTHDEALKIHRQVCANFDPANVKRAIFSVIKPDSDECIGYCGFQYCEILGDTELTYGFARKHWGNGYGYEAAKRMLQYGFEELKLPRIVAAVNPENVASERILQKIGMQYVGKVAWKDQGMVNHYQVLQTILM